VEKLHGATHKVVADRIECGTFLCAVAATGGDVFLQDGRAEHLGAVIDLLIAAGAKVEPVKGGIRVRSEGRLHAQSFKTTEYPGFPTDMQAQFMALNCISEGDAKIAETIFENRFMHVSELMRMGARIDVDGKVAITHGVESLSGAIVMATDLPRIRQPGDRRPGRRGRNPWSIGFTISTVATSRWKPSCARSAPKSKE
jgi:UDP-N-acetylglucosamine 1-carboxyvinyltransferase